MQLPSTSLTHWADRGISVIGLPDTSNCNQPAGFGSTIGRHYATSRDSLAGFIGMRRVITRFDKDNIRANQPLLGLLTAFA
jgi:hypothetical protein